MVSHISTHPRSHAFPFAHLISVLATVLLLSLGTACTTPRAVAENSAAQSALSEETNAVKVLTTREGQTTHFYVQNGEYCEVTLTTVMSLVNLKSDHPFPYTTTVPARKRTELFTLTPIEADGDWKYDYTNYYKLGSNRAHPDHYVYRLPYAPGESFAVTQGYDGSFSHTGPNEYAIDFAMPQGTLVCAARGGLVVRVKDDSDTGGPSMKFDPFNNYILIRHADGTLGHYCHLEQHSSLVKVGEFVSAGQPIAHSGSTGFSTGPHLHFCVFMNKDGRHRVSIPVKFMTARSPAVTLVQDHTYEAAPIQIASRSVR